MPAPLSRSPLPGSFIPPVRIKESEKRINWNQKFQTNPEPWTFGRYHLMVRVGKCFLMVGLGALVASGLATQYLRAKSLVMIASASTLLRTDFVALYNDSCR